jgi:hypothetical protein
MTERWGGEPTEAIPGAGSYGGYGDQRGRPVDPTRVLPPSRRPPGAGGPDRRRQRRIWLVVAGVLAAAIIIVLVILLLTSSGGNSNHAVTINSFNVPSTVNCSGPTTIGVSWSTTNATQVVLSIDGSAPYKTYSGSNGADTVPFACNGGAHTYAITATSGSGARSTRTQTVTQISTPTTTPRTTTTTKPPPTTTAPTTTTTSTGPTTT